MYYKNLTENYVYIIHPRSMIRSTLDLAKNINSNLFIRFIQVYMAFICIILLYRSG